MGEGNNNELKPKAASKAETQSSLAQNVFDILKLESPDFWEGKRHVVVISDNGEDFKNLIAGQSPNSEVSNLSIDELDSNVQADLIIDTESTITGVSLAATAHIKANHAKVISENLLPGGHYFQVGVFNKDDAEVISEFGLRFVGDIVEMIVKDN